MASNGSPLCHGYGGHAVAESYQYDSLGHRTCSVRFQSGISTTNYYIYAASPGSGGNGIQCVADIDSSGNLLRSYTWGPGIDNLLAMTVYTGTVTKTYYALTDHLGTVHALTDSSGNIVESYKYDAWGRVLGVYDNGGNPLTSDLGSPTSEIGNRYLWQGREYSYATGLYNFRARWYDPVTGRWLSKDPIGISGGLNQYVFCNNNGVNFVDPYGTQEIFIGIDWALLEEPPITPRPILPEGWRPGNSMPKGFRPPPNPKGNWFNPKTGESLRPDLNHPEPVRPHFDYRDPAGKWWRIFEDGTREPKSIPTSSPSSSPYDTIKA